MRAILVAIVLALASPAMAAQNGLPLTGHPKQDFNNIVHPDQGSNEQQQSGGGATSGSKCTAKNLLECLGDDIINKISPDLEYADALAHQNNNKITAPCLDAILALIQGWQAQVYPIGPDGKPATNLSPLTLPDPHAIVVLERVSELIQQLQPNSTISLGCAPLQAAAQKDITTLVGTVLSGGALGLLKLPIVPIP